MTRAPVPSLEFPTCAEARSIGAHIVPWLVELERACGAAALAVMEHDGASAQEIATRLGITTRSVARHRHRLHQRAALTASTRKPAR